MYALREAVAAIGRAPLLTALSASMVALALFVAGLFVTVTYNLHEALAVVEERVEVIAYVRDDAGPDELALGEAALLDLEEVRAVRFVSKEDALRLARENLPEFREIFMGLEVNPLPASLEVELQPGHRDPESVARVAGMMTLFPFVEDVTYGQDWVDRLHHLRRAGAIATMILGGSFAIVAALIIVTAVRIAIFARSDEIRIMRLVGATNGFIRGPFLLEGFLTGIVGGILAAGLTYSAYLAGHRLIFPLSWIPGEWVLGGTLAGGTLGVMASALAVRKYLREV